MILRVPTIFLDFDGVLHTMGNTGYKPFHQLGLLERELSTVTCDFQIVVSSSWRFHYSVEELRGQLGALSGRVTGVTPELCTDHAFISASSHNPSGKFGYMWLRWSLPSLQISE